MIHIQRDYYTIGNYARWERDTLKRIVMDEKITEQAAAFPYDVTPGMSLRDYFAAAALTRLVAQDKDGMMGPTITATACYRLADAMLTERAK